MLKGIILAGMLLNTGMVSVFAKTVEGSLVDDRAQLSAVKSKISVVDQHIDALLVKQNQAEQQLAELEKKIADHAVALRELQRQIDQKNSVINKTETSIRRQAARVERQKQALKQQVLAAYHVKQQDRIKLVLNNQDPALSGRLIKYYDCLSKRRIAKIAQLRLDEESLVSLQQQQKHTVAMIERDLQGKQSEQSVLNDTKQERARLLQQVQQQVVHGKKMLVQLKDNERSLANLLVKLQHSSETVPNKEQKAVFTVQDTPIEQPEVAGENQEITIKEKPDTVDSEELLHTEPALLDSGNRFSQSKGQLGWPVIGKVYNRKNSDALSFVRGGIFVEADEGALVRAVAKGKIVYAGWMKSYGLMTIVDHSEGYMTIYAFNQSLLKKVGAQVQSGEAIASVGQSGGRSINGLYFGVRKNGIALNPIVWCKKK